MTTQDKIIWMRQSIKVNKQIILINKNNLNTWKKQHSQSPIFQEMKTHLLTTFRHTIDNSLDHIKWCNNQIKQLNNQ